MHTLPPSFVPSAMPTGPTEVGGLPSGNKGDGRDCDLEGDMKPRYDLTPPHAYAGVVAVLTYGAKKYDPWNWAKGIAYSRLFAAIMRHLWAWWKGEDFDKESGLHHLDHACCDIMMLRDMTVIHADKDDRRGNQPGCVAPGTVVTVPPEIFPWPRAKNIPFPEAGSTGTPIVGSTTPTVFDGGTPDV